MSKWSSVMLSVLRIATALTFVEHGTSKVLNFPPAAAAAHSGPSPAGIMATLGQISGPMELIGGALVLFGLFTRPAAFLLSGEMAVAYFTVHAKMDLYPMNNHGEVAVLYCFIFLYLAFAGAGPISVDKMRGKA
jgi:putative oxidoreductase